MNITFKNSTKKFIVYTKSIMVRQLPLRYTICKRKSGKSATLHRSRPGKAFLVHA